MQVALSLLPPAVVLLAVLGFRASGLMAALVAALTAGGVWLGLGASGGADLVGQAGHAVVDAGVLASLVAAMVVPGMLFVEATRGRKSPEAIGALVQAIGLARPQAAILVAVGIGVMVESLTGMGVSLLVTMPLLVGMLDKRAAIGVGLVGMSLMPWGALAISAHVAAKLAGLPVEELQGWITSISGPVAFFLPALVLLFVPDWRAGDLVAALAAGVVLVAAIALSTSMIGVEVAGVGGGLAVITLMALLARSRSGLGVALAAPGLVPYLVLLAAVVAQKFSVGPLARLGIQPALATERVSFALLTSPGVALLAATLLSAAWELTPALLARVAARAWRPVLGIALFMLSARLLIELGAIATLARSLGGLGPVGATVAVAGLAAVGGFVTGSGVTGNALFMPSAAAAGKAIGALPVLAALQNAASGHVGMAALPVGAILLATLPRREAGDEATIMRLGLMLAAWHVCVATIAALALLAFVRS